MVNLVVVKKNKLIELLTNFKQILLKKKVDDKKVVTRHKNVIHGFNVTKSSDDKVSEFTTGALDGRILYWAVSDLEKALSFTN